MRRFACGMIGVWLLAMVAAGTPTVSGQVSPVPTPTVTSPLATPTAMWPEPVGTGTPQPTAIRLSKFTARSSH